MNELFTILGLIVGELLGDATFFLAGYHKNKKAGDNREEKRKQYYITIYSVFIAILAFVAVNALKAFFWIWPTLFADLKPWWDSMENIAGTMGRFCSIAVFMFFYRKIRKGWAKVLQKKLLEPFGESGDPLGIYVCSERPGQYELSEKWVYIKDCVRFLVIINLLFLSLLHLIPEVNEAAGSVMSFNSLVLIPIMASAVLMEFYNYLSFDDDSFFGGRKDEEGKESVLDLVRLKTAYEGRKIPGLSLPLNIKKHDNRIDEAMRDYMEKLSRNREPDIKLFVDYLGKRRWSVRRHYHTGSLETTVRLIRGENIFYASPFYKDIDICIFFMAYLTVTKGRKVLILAEDGGNLNGLAQWLRQGMEEVQRLDDYYQVDVLNETRDDLDLGVLSFQDLYRPEDFGRLKRFFSKVGFVVVIEASGMLAGGQEAISNLAEYTGNPLDGCTWLLCDNNAESMLDLFSHLLNKSFIYVSATPLSAEDSLVVYWDVEKEVLQPWEPVKHYLGAELQAAEVAWCNEVEQVTLYGEEVVPIYDMKWIAGQYYRQFHKLTGRKPHQYVMDSGIDMGISGNDCQMQEECFLIVEDCNFNLYETARQYVTRASKKAMVHILSPNYMMRDFMKSKDREADADPKYIAQFVPEYVNTRRNVAVHLIRKMLSRPVTEMEIREKLDRSEGGGGSFNGLEDVKNLVRLAVPDEDFKETDIIVSWQNRLDRAAGMNVQERCYQLDAGKVRRQFVRYFQKACYIAEDGEKRHINKLILAGHLDQKYLKGQLVVFGGIYYEIMKRQVTDYEYILHVCRASEQVSGRRYYRQNRKYELSNIKEYSYGGAGSQAGNPVVSSYTADIQAETSGYYMCRGWNEIADAAYTALKKEDILVRKYFSKQFLKVKIDAENPEEAKIMAVQMACLLQESFCTFYPQQYHLLSVALDRKRYIMENESVLQGVLADIELKEQDDENEEVCFYIIEDSMEDMGLLRSIERNFGRIQILLSGYMKWNMENDDKYLLFGRKVTDEDNGSNR